MNSNSNAYLNIPNWISAFITPLTNLKLIKICDLYANDITVIREAIGKAPAEMLWDLVEANKEMLFQKYDQAAMLYVSKYVNTARANSITIFDRKDFLY